MSPSNDTVNVMPIQIQSNASSSYPIWLPSLVWLTVIFLILRFFGPLSSRSRGNVEVDAPIVGPSHTILARYEFFRNARYYVETGYAKAMVALSRV